MNTKTMACFLFGARPVFLSIESLVAIYYDRKNANLYIQLFVTWVVIAVAAFICTVLLLASTVLTLAFLPIGVLLEPMIKKQLQYQNQKYFWMLCIGVFSLGIVSLIVVVLAPWVAIVYAIILLVREVVRLF